MTGKWPKKGPVAHDADGAVGRPRGGGGGGGLAGGLHVVSTPIGNARDITLRALDILRDADALAAEDTRALRRLMEIHGVPLNGRPLIAYHDHSGPAERRRILSLLAEGRAVALTSEAGTPLVADPGYKLTREALEAGVPLFAAPGASAVLAALAVAGAPSDRFLFAGFLAPKSAARRAGLAELAALRATLVFYESPRRLGASLADMAAVLGPDRPAAMCRELTKRFETVARGPLSALATTFQQGPPVKGEVVIVIHPPDPDATPPDIDEALRAAMVEMRLKDAVRMVAETTGAPRREVYARALALKGDGLTEN